MMQLNKGGILSPHGLDLSFIDQGETRDSPIFFLSFPLLDRHVVNLDAQPGRQKSPNTGAWLSINHVFAPYAYAHAHAAIMIAPVTWAVVALGALTPLVAAAPEDGLPSYHYGASIPVECMSRNSYVPSMRQSTLPC